jgi:uncharacterized protein (UPF0548 family)
VFFAGRPAENRIREFIERQRDQPFSYRAEEKGHVVDHNRIRLGDGVRGFESARRAVREWKMFDMSWVKLCWPDVPIESGATVAVLVSHYGFWSLNAARIVYAIDEPNRFGFAYGTLFDHAESGEERFMVELLDDGSVWYDLYAFSRPRAIMARLGYPISRALQRRFVRDSLAAMKRNTARILNSEC